MQSGELTVAAFVARTLALGERPLAKEFQAVPCAVRTVEVEKLGGAALQLPHALAPLKSTVRCWYPCRRPSLLGREFGARAVDVLQRHTAMPPPAGSPCQGCPGLLTRLGGGAPRGGGAAAPTDAAVAGAGRVR